MYHHFSSVRCGFILLTIWARNAWRSDLNKSPGPICSEDPWAAALTCQQFPMNAPAITDRAMHTLGCARLKIGGVLRRLSLYTNVKRGFKCGRRCSLHGTLHETLLHETLYRPAMENSTTPFSNQSTVQSKTRRCVDDGHDHDNWTCRSLRDACNATPASCCAFHACLTNAAMPKNSCVVPT